MRRGVRPPSVAFLCPGCGREIALALTEAGAGLPCPGCGRRQPMAAAGAVPGTGALRRCVHCGTDRLYVQKDFNKKAGLWVFVIAAALSVPTWGLSLLIATLVDLGLYFALGDATVCYDCGAVHRGFPKNPEHGAFDIHVQEAVDRARPARGMP